MIQKRGLRLTTCRSTWWAHHIIWLICIWQLENIGFLYRCHMLFISGCSVFSLKTKSFLQFLGWNGLESTCSRPWSTFSFSRWMRQKCYSIGRVTQKISYHMCSLCNKTGCLAIVFIWIKQVIQNDIDLFFNPSWYPIGRWEKLCISQPVGE